MSGLEFRRILVPLQFTPAASDCINAGRQIALGDAAPALAKASLRALQLAAQVAPDATLRLLHVTPALDRHSIYGATLGSGSLQSAIESIHRGANEASVDLLQKIGARFCPDKKIELDARAGHAVEIILEVANQERIDLIVLAASSRSAVARFVMGSSADQIIRRAPCPVMVIPSQVTVDGDDPGHPPME